MVVQHNLTAMNSNRMLGVTTSAQAKSSEKLSSGYRINRAADDAAGLTISEKMRKQMRGLDRASTNAQDGVSAVQTAEGALTEVHSMLQRMNELANQAANGSNSESDRDAIQAEVDQLTTEIDRVSETTKFNETYLLKGNADGNKTINTINAHDAGLKGKLTGVGTGTATFTADAFKNGDKVTIAGTEYTINLDVAGQSTTIDQITDDTAAAAYGKKEVDQAGTAAKTELDLTDWKAGDSFTIGAKTYDQTTYNDIDALVTQLTTDLGADFTVAKDTNKLVITAKTAGAQTAAVAITSATVNGAAATATVTAGTDTTYKYTAFADKAELEAAIGAGTDIYHGDVDTKANFTPLAANTITAEDAYVLMAAELEKASNIGTDSNTKAAVVNKNDGTFEITEGKAETAEKLSFSLHVGADADMTNKINVDIDTMSASGLGIQGINVSDKTGMAATYAIDAIADAIAKVSSQRSALGAVQNRLEHTIANLDNVVENTTAAESRIRDTDMAEEMVTYSKNNILAQAGQSMLAQANQSNQGVLSLLQ